MELYTSSSFTTKHGARFTTNKRTGHSTKTVLTQNVTKTQLGPTSTLSSMKLLKNYHIIHALYTNYCSMLSSLSLSVNFICVDLVLTVMVEGALVIESSTGGTLLFDSRDLNSCPFNTLLMSCVDVCVCVCVCVCVSTCVCVCVCVCACACACACVCVCVCN